MDGTTAGPNREPARLTVGGIPRRRAIWIGSILAAVLVPTAVLGPWLANFEPLGVDGGGMGIRPPHLVVEQFDATPPRGGGFVQYRIALGPGERFGFFFDLHNDSPFPVTLTGFDPGAVPWGPRILEVRAGSRTHGASSPLPYTILPHTYAPLFVRAGFRGCLDEGVSTFIGDLGLTFRMFGLVERHTRVLLPMTIEIVGAPGVRCSYS
jgi:hypothetical protein